MFTFLWRLHSSSHVSPVAVLSVKQAFMSGGHMEGTIGVGWTELCGRFPSIAVARSWNV